jgi:hypothetical protein
MANGSKRSSIGLVAASLALAASFLLVVPADAQLFGGPGYDRSRPPPSRGFNPFRDFFGPFQRPYDAPQYREQQRPAVDYSRAPAAQKRDGEASRFVVVLGDSMADWLAYGLEDAFSERPEFGVVRKNRIGSGLIRYESRSDADWAKVARDYLNAEKADAVVIMLGPHDRQAIRESQMPEAARDQKKTDDQSIAAPEPRRQPGAPAHEFQSEKWGELYGRLIDHTIAALKSKGVPVIWVGLPPIRGTKSTSDMAYLNELFKSRAEKAGIIYVDVWDGFVDEAGRFISHGPDVDGQRRALRSGDGVYFTKFGARKLAHYVERELLRALMQRPIPVALPGAQPGDAPGERPIAGPVVPLNALAPSGGELLGAGNPAPGSADAAAARVLVKGESVAAPQGRADNFQWPRRDVEVVPGAIPASATHDAPDTPVKSAKPPPAKQATAPPATPRGTTGDATRRPVQQQRPQAAPAPRTTDRDIFRRPPAPVGPPSFGPLFGR